MGLMEKEINDRILGAVMTAEGTEVICRKCGVTEFILALDKHDVPFEQAELDHYICAHCEAIFFQ